MLKKIQQWFVKDRPPSDNLEPLVEETLPPLGDSDYEFLFNQVLEGVAHGWQRERVQKFFDQTQARISLTQWVEWLGRFGSQAIESPHIDHQLVQRLELLANQTQYLPGYSEIGAAAYALAHQILLKSQGNEIWEYDGPDGTGEESFPPGTEAFTIEELYERLQQSPELRQALSQQFSLNTDDPMVIVQALVYQMSQENSEV